MVVVTLRVWFHGPAGEEVTHCVVANILRHLAKLERKGQGIEEEREQREWREGRERREGREEERRKMEVRERKGGRDRGEYTERGRHTCDLNHGR